MIPLGVLGGARHVTVPVWEGILGTSYVTSGTQPSLTVTATGTPGRLLVSPVAIDKNAGHTISASSGWTIAASYVGTSVSGALAYRLATGSDDITWTISGSKLAIASVHEWSGLTNPALDAVSIFPTPPDNLTRRIVTANAGSGGGLAVAFASVDTAPPKPATPEWTNQFVSRQSEGFGLTSYGPSPIFLAERQFSIGEPIETTATLPVTDQSFLILATFT